VIYGIKSEVHKLSSIILCAFSSATQLNTNKWTKITIDLITFIFSHVDWGVGTNHLTKLEPTPIYFLSHQTPSSQTGPKWSQFNLNTIYQFRQIKSD
jgi:hypothetical protein